MVASLNALIEKHVSTLQKMGEDLLTAMEAEPANVEKACAISHMIKGSAGSLGFRKLSEITTKIEDDCKEAGDAQITFDAADIQELRQHILELSAHSSEIFQADL